MPLIHQSFNWQHGTFLGSIVSSEQTAAAAGKVGELRYDPFAMLPFCGYHMGDYFNHWLNIGKQADPDKLPKIFYVNWFRKNKNGKYLWPGFGENSRVLKWVIERVCGEGKADKTPIGWIPTKDALYLDDLDISTEDLEELLRVDTDEWKRQVPLIRQHLTKFGNRLPAGLRDEINALERRLADS